ncbi:MAG: hypothetical protein JWQ43_647 [Glaciihabitans sp.]|nr:hypothetical protein [Glaciihabitans sp.]
MTERRLPMNTRDRMLRGEVVTAIIGPIVVPSRDQVVQALLTIARHGHHTRIPLGFHVDAKNWVVDDDELKSWCEGMVVTIAPATAETINSIALRQAWLVDAERPLRFVLAGDYVIQVNDHALGDGVMLMDRLTTVLRVAAGGQDLPPWVTTVPAHRPIQLALRHTFLHTKSAIRRLLADRRADRSSRESRDIGPVRPWRPELAVATATAPVASLKQIQSWIRSTDRSLTVAAALLVVLRRALESSGMELQNKTEVIYNLRRYLPPEVSLVDSNFIAGLPVQVSDPNDVKQVDEAMRRQFDSGRPLAVLLLGVIQHVIFGNQFKMPTEVGQSPRASMVFNNMGVSRSLQQLPWTAPVEGRSCNFVVRADGPEDITLIIVIVAGAIHLTAAFNSNVFDEARLSLALQEALDNPLAHLTVHAEA